MKTYKVDLTQFKKLARQQMDFVSMWVVHIFRQRQAVIQTSFRDHHAENKLWALIFEATWKITATRFIVFLFECTKWGD